MSLNSNLLKEYTFFTNADDEETMVYKLEKIGVNREAIAIKTFPPSSLRKQYVVEVNDEEYIRCVNCSHVKVSHEDQKENDFKCYGLIDNQNCNCKKFISITGKTTL